MSYFQRVRSVSAHCFLFLITAVSLLFSGYSYAESASSFVSIPPLINASASGDKPNVLIVLDNSNSMDEAPSGQAVGSANPGSKSEIARGAVKGIIDSFGERSRLGLMGYKQANVVGRRLHDSQYDVSFRPSDYDPDFTGDRASQTKNKRVINPTDSDRFIYYNVALPFYSSTNQGNRFCYSSTADFDNGSETESGPWDTYFCYRNKTGTSNSGTTGFSNYAFGGGFQATDSDFAQNILDFGTYLTWQYVSRTWFSNESPGKGYLHVPIDDLNAAHRKALMDKLATSQFTSSSDTPLRNAGLTPIAGTLDSAGEYFVGNLSSSDAASGVSTALPPANQCGVQNFVVLVTDGLPSVDKSGNKISDTAAGIQAAADEAADLLDAGIRTYVVGFGLPPGVDGTLLNEIAEAGGTGTTLLANDSETLDNALSGIFLDIFNRASSSSAAAVLANNARGEGAVFQALYSPSIQDSEGAEVTWTGSLFGLFIDQSGLLREDTNGNGRLDGYNVDRVANYVFNAAENRTDVELFSSSDATTPPDIANGSPVDTVALDDIKPLWRARDQLSAISDPVTQRDYGTSAANGRYILTSIDGENTLDFKPIPDGEVLGDLVDKEQEAKAALDTAKAEYSVAQAQFSAAEESVVDQQADVVAAENNLSSKENNVVLRTDELAVAEEETVIAKQTYESELDTYNANEPDVYNQSLSAQTDFSNSVDDYSAQKSQSDLAFDSYVLVLIAEGGNPLDTNVMSARSEYEAALAALENRISDEVSGGLNAYNAAENDFQNESADTIADCIVPDIYRGTECQSFYETEKTQVDDAFDIVNTGTLGVTDDRDSVKLARTAYVEALGTSGANTNRPAVKNGETVYNNEIAASDTLANSTFNAGQPGSSFSLFADKSNQFRNLAQTVVDSYLDYKTAQDSEAEANDALSDAVAERDQAIPELANEEQLLVLTNEDRDTANATLLDKASALATAEAAYRSAFNNTFLNYLDTGTGETANKVVRFVRGEEGISGFRNRTLEDGVRLLGDIVNSTPALVASPSSGYDVLHGDDTYAAFREKYKDRRNVVYVGGNDGMLHAFNAGFWNGADRSFQVTNSFTGASDTAVAHPLGAELWSYIPKAALPHLQWLTDPNYAHTYYVDGKPQTFDVNIFPDDETHPNGWGTVLVVGMGLGGGTTQIDSNADGTDDQTLRSSYIVLDITDPEQPPELLAEISHDELAYTTSTPALFKQRQRGTGFDSPSKNNWSLVFGSGPTDLGKVTSDQVPRLYVYDLAAKAFEPGYPRLLSQHANSFVGDVGVVDWQDDYLDDTAYFGIISGDPASSSSGAVERLRISENGTGTISTLIDTGRPVTAEPHLTKDGQGRRWVYFGTGRLFEAADNVTTAQNRFYGLYEPVDASGVETSAEVFDSGLFNVTDIQVKDTGAVSDGGGNSVTIDTTEVDTFNRLKFELPRQKQGWYRNLENDGTNPTERNVSKADSIRSVLFYTTYKPSTNECTPEGTSRLFGVDFQTGVAPPFDVFSPEDSTEAADDEVVPPSILLGQGLASAPTIVSNRSGGRLDNSSDSVVTIVTQSSTGQLQLNEAKVGTTSSSRQSWREITK
jgi:Tfp pilus tip-associated adhesin PilY1